MYSYHDIWQTRDQIVDCQKDILFMAVLNVEAGVSNLK
jgi:hypothetical protein